MFPAKFATRLFRNFSTKEASIPGGKIDLHVWFPMDKKSLKQIAMPHALMKSKLWNKAFVGHASLSMHPVISVNPAELEGFTTTLEHMKKNSDEAYLYLRNITEHPEKKFPLYMSIWQDEEEENYSTDTSFKPGINNSSLKDDIEAQGDRNPTNTVTLTLTESEMKNVYCSALKKICDTLQKPRQLPWGLIGENCAHHVFDSLCDARILAKNQRSGILTPEMLFTMVNEVKEKRENKNITRFNP